MERHGKGLVRCAMVAFTPAREELAAVYIPNGLQDMQDMLELSAYVGSIAAKPTKT